MQKHGFSALALGDIGVGEWGGWGLMAFDEAKPGDSCNSDTLIPEPQSARPSPQDCVHVEERRDESPFGPGDWVRVLDASSVTETSDTKAVRFSGQMCPLRAEGTK